MEEYEFVSDGTLRKLLVQCEVLFTFSKFESKSEAAVVCGDEGSGKSSGSEVSTEVGVDAVDIDDVVETDVAEEDDRDFAVGIADELVVGSKVLVRRLAQLTSSDSE